MPTVTKSIGTSSRDYSTITLWEADLDSGSIYAAGDTAVGECYADSAFNETITINGGGTIGLAARTLTVASGHRHNGSAGTGARNARTSSGTTLTLQTVSSTVSWLELDFTGLSVASATTYATVANSSGLTQTLSHLLAHGGTVSSGNFIGLTSTGGGGTAQFIGNMVYDLEETASSGAVCWGIYDQGGAGAPAKIVGNTVHSITKTSGTGTAYGIGMGADAANRQLQNNLVTDVGGTTSGTKQCYAQSSFSSATCSHNIASDTSASGTGSLDSKASSSQFVSTTSGFEDLHLKAGADAINAGTDLGTTPTGVNYDIDNRDRDALGDTWDIGADEYVAAAGSYVPAFGRSSMRAFSINRYG